MSWSVRLPLDLTINYLNRDGRRRRQQMSLKTLEWDLTATGTPRIAMKGWVQGDDEAHGKPKTLHLHRALSAIDNRTGEIFDEQQIADFLARELTARGLPQPPRWIGLGAYQLRVTEDDIDVQFGADNLAVGWFFAVPSAFRAALDIVRLPASADGKWSRGLPPYLDFSEGDHFHAPARPRDAWERQRMWMTWTLHVQKIFNEEGVCLAIREWIDGNAAGLIYVAARPVQIEQILRLGPDAWKYLSSSGKPFLEWPHKPDAEIEPAAGDTVGQEVMVHAATSPATAG
ncbi:hypothetical protein [Niveispirillum sp.]|uniref:hypothetical protein n=1 Tax=Niveispirillum sp. TaxID=1917217 RepID=UPI001B6F6F88|nr:hypothetical protein [Niveispirillum sp.]MBP7336885.1 hypothetical protein [Niveispirillum sp.]